MWFAPPVPLRRKWSASSRRGVDCNRKSRRGGRSVAGEDNGKTEELTALVQEIRDRVRARYPGPDALKHLRITLPDLLPLVHARDAAEAKVASIGTVNPRRGGPLNAVAQFIKKMVARALDWHVREQV